jgi:hypothetical protein
LNRECKSDWLFVIGYGGREKRSGIFKGERQRLAGCVTHLAGRLFNHGRAKNNAEFEDFVLFFVNSASGVDA